MDPSSFQCPNCESSYVKLDSLRVHWTKKHKLTSLELQLLLFHNNVRPTCECGCKEHTRFETLQLGFARFVNGHNARVHNSWGHNPIAMKKSHDVQRELWKTGGMTKWRLGLSVDDPRNKALIEKMTFTARTDLKLRAHRSKMMSENRLNGTVQTLTGSLHPGWKGGTSALQPACRSKLFNVWTYPRLKASNFKCNECASSSKLEVHHDVERFAAILQLAIKELGEPGENFEKKSAIANWVADYHVENDVSGVVLCNECHDKRHVKS